MSSDELRNETEQDGRTSAIVVALVGLFGLLWAGTDAIWNQGPEMYHWAVVFISGVLVAVSRRRAMGASV